MKTLKWILFVGLFQSGVWATASDIGDAYVRLGQQINQSTLTSDQVQNLNTKLAEAQDILNGGVGSLSFICVQGTIYGPNKQEIWSGDSNACQNPTKVYIQGDYACVTGALYGLQGQISWTGDSSACGDRSKVKIGNHYACAVGTIYGPGGFQKWTGDSNYCAKAVLN